MPSQSFASIGRSLFRITFRGGSPERIRYSDRLLLIGLLGTLLATVAAERLFFERSLLETGLTLFTLFSGVFLGAAILGRRVSRMRLRVALQSFWLLLLTAVLVLALLTPLVTFRPGIRTGVGVTMIFPLFLGTTNLIQYLRGGSRLRAAATTLAFFVVLGAFHTILSSLLEILFS